MSAASCTLSEAPTAHLILPFPSTLDRRADRATPVGPRNPDSTILQHVGGQTWVVAELVAPIAGNYIISMLRQARAAVRLRISQVGDGLIAGGVFIWQGYGGHVLRVENGNNHQQTMGVIGAALETILDFLNTQTEHGVGFFTVYDGANEVGVGVIL